VVSAWPACRVFSCLGKLAVFYKSRSAKWFAERFTAPAAKAALRTKKIDSIPSIYSTLPYRPLVIDSKRVNTDVEFVMIGAARGENQEAPAREAERQENKRMIAS
jgi:hypothetical protein